MSLEVSVNLNSLSMVREELDNTIIQAASEFEVYLANTEELQQLESSRELIAQVGGIFRLLEYPGAALLAEEISELRLLLVTLKRKPPNQQWMLRHMACLCCLGILNMWR